MSEKPTTAIEYTDRCVYGQPSISCVFWSHERLGALEQGVQVPVPSPRTALAAFLPATPAHYHPSEIPWPQGGLTRQPFKEVRQEINQPRKANFSYLNSSGAL